MKKTKKLVRKTNDKIFFLKEEYLEENRFDLLGRLYRLSAQHKKKDDDDERICTSKFSLCYMFFSLSVCVFRSGDSVDASCVISFVSFFRRGEKIGGRLLRLLEHTDNASGRNIYIYITTLTFCFFLSFYN